MGKNQHVTPHPSGGWQVKGEGNIRATVRTTTQKMRLASLEELPAIKAPSWSFIDPTDESGTRTPMGRTLSLQEDNTSGACPLGMPLFYR